MGTPSSSLHVRQSMEYILLPPSTSGVMVRSSQVRLTQSFIHNNIKQSIRLSFFLVEGNANFSPISLPCSTNFLSFCFNHWKVGNFTSKFTQSSLKSSSLTYPGRHGISSTRK